MLLVIIFGLRYHSSLGHQTSDPRPALAVPSRRAYARFRDTDVPRLLPVKVYYPQEHVTNAACNV